MKAIPLIRRVEGACLIMSFRHNKGSGFRNISPLKQFLKRPFSLLPSLLFTRPLDKISELDSMMLDGESSSSRGSQLSLASSVATDLDSTLVPEPQSCPDVLSSHCGKPATQYEHKSHQVQDNVDGTLNDKEAPKCPAEEASGVESGAHVRGCAGRGETSQTEELSFDLLFDSLDEIKAGPSGSLSPARQDHDLVNTSSSSSGSTGSKPVNTTKDRHTLNSSQPIKRKSHSPFNTSSPTKLSKLM